MNSLASTLFLTRDLAHKLHLKTTSHAVHMALGEFYENIINLADRLIEVYQGKHGRIEIPQAKEPEIEDPAEALKICLKLIQKLRYEDLEKTDTPLQNILDEIEAQFYSTFYKLSLT